VGVGEIIGNMFNGKLLDVIGFKPLVVVLMFEMFLCFGLLLWYTQRNEWNFELASGLGFIYGF